jgi:hypothetical protein
MTYQIKVEAFHDDIIEWLQENVGPVEWSSSPHVWRGSGWKLVVSMILPKKNATVSTYEYEITVDDPELAALATLRWA